VVKVSGQQKDTYNRYISLSKIYLGHLIVTSHHKRTGGDRHSLRKFTYTEATQSTSPLSLPEAVRHGLILLLLSKPNTLHPTLHNIEWVAPQPEQLARQATMHRNFPRRSFVRSMLFLAFLLIMYLEDMNQQPYACDHHPGSQFHRSAKGRRYDSKTYL
jgi:hypothetical protein